MKTALDLGARPSGHLSGYAVDQAWPTYTPEQHATWLTLYDRQREVLEGRACDAFMRGLDALDLRSGGVPDFDRVNPRLEALTGWRIVPVAGLVPDAVFFDFLAHRRFPAARFIREPAALDYLSEPDIFHDVFGHAPMLTDPIFADYMQAYGEGGLRALGLNHLHHLARLYWYTVEFGLLRENEALRIYGAGIVSSRSETVFALEDPSPNRLDFDLTRVMRTGYRIDDFQQSYFVIPSMAALLDVTLQDFAPVYGELERSSDVAPDAALTSDRNLTRGTQAHALSHSPIPG